MRYKFLNRLLIPLLFVFVSLTAFKGSESLDGKESSNFFQDDKRKKHKNKAGKSEARIFPFNDLGVPKGHLPPPGQCKIWIPGKPPGQQSPPQSCRSAFRNAPLGAWVITHSADRYKVNIFSATRPTVVSEIRFYALQ
jgi:hypothetical protein